LRQQKNEEHTLKRRIWWSSNVSSRTSSAPERPYIMLILCLFCTTILPFTQRSSSKQHTDISLLYN
jgi:hypothetical protein